MEQQDRRAAVQKPWWVLVYHHGLDPGPWCAGLAWNLCATSFEV